MMDRFFHSGPGGETWVILSKEYNFRLLFSPNSYQVILTGKLYHVARKCFKYTSNF